MADCAAEDYHLCIKFPEILGFLFPQVDNLIYFHLHSNMLDLLDVWKIETKNTSLTLSLANDLDEKM